MLKLSAACLIVSLSLCAANQVLAQHALNPPLNQASVANSMQAEKFAVEQTFQTSDARVTIRAKQPLDISTLLPKVANIGKMNSEVFVAAVDKARRIYFPDEDIAVEAIPSQVRPKAVDDYLGVRKSWRWNVAMGYNGYARYTWTGSNGTAGFLVVQSGSVRPYLMKRNYWVNYGNMSSGVTWADSVSGYPGEYGSFVRCLSSFCKFHIVTFVYW